MNGRRTREALLDFLDYLSEKGLMERATVQARKAASSQILGILEGEEAEDVTAVDVEDVVARFGRLFGKKYTPQSLMTYKSRLRSALEDFKSYLDNPLAFRPSVQNRDRRPKTKDASEPVKTADLRPAPVRSMTSAPSPTHIVPIPIRADLTVYIQGLPFDLSEAEARKIANVVTAMVA
jgi:site-specific recombinase XerD